jgi:hypothetical protein
MNPTQSYIEPGETVMIYKINAFIKKSKSAIFPVAGTVIAGITQAFIILALPAY